MKQREKEQRRKEGSRGEERESSRYLNPLPNLRRLEIGSVLGVVAYSCNFNSSGD